MARTSCIAGFCTAVVAVAVWAFWLGALGPDFAFSNLLANWKMALTMVFGSLVAGGTSLGGGAVAFPVFTKVLGIAPREAKIFSLAIQSVGMSAASITLVAIRAKIDWRVVRWASFGGVPGLATGSILLFPGIPPELVKTMFSAMVGTFALVLVVFGRASFDDRHERVPIWKLRERAIMLCAGFLGGIVSGLFGSGIDIVLYILLFLLFGICEKNATQTSVVIMAFNAICGFLLHYAVLRDVEPSVIDYWLAAVPVVVIGAPAGAYLCNRLTRKKIRRLLVSLILAEICGTVFLVRITSGTVIMVMGCILLFTLLFAYLNSLERYKSLLPVNRGSNA